MVMVLARALMLFAPNSAMAFSGLLCESAMIRIAFQSSLIRNLPFSDSCDLAALVFAIVTIELHGSSARQGGPISACHQPSTISRALAAGQGWLGRGHAHAVSILACPFRALLPASVDLTRTRLNSSPTS